MSYTAQVLRVMIASPGDVADARDAVEAAIHGWNDANARNKQIILHPWRWETSAVPVLGGRPQELINAQGVDDSDIVFALFGSRLGSPTRDAVSGTVEEIERALEQGKPVHLYFSTAPLPNDVDTAQLEGLRDFRREIQNRGLLGEFSSPSQLNHEVWKAIEHDVAALNLGVPVLVSKATGVDLLVQPQQERVQTGVDKRGKVKYRTSYWLEIVNRGTADAEDVRFEPVGENPSLLLMGSDKPTVIHAGQARRINYTPVWNGDDDLKLRVMWSENGQQQEREFHVG
ncbi:hypothetical protein ACQPW3_11210 [Actinosynnema sp. CA-248983]